MAHPAGAEDAAAAADHVMARHAGRLVDDDKTRVHSVMAVKTRPRSTDQRPASELSGGPDSVAPSINIVDSNDPADPGSVDLERDVRVFETQPTLGQREPRFVRCFLGAEQNSIPMHAGGQRGKFMALGRQADRVQHTVGQHVVRFGVDTHRTHNTRAPHHRAAKARAVREAADHAVGPARLALLPLEDRHWRKPDLAQGDTRAVPHGDELVAPLGHRPGDQRFLLGQWRQAWWVGIQLGTGQVLDAGQHRRHQRGQRHRGYRCRRRSRNCCACAFISGVMTK